MTVAYHLADGGSGEGKFAGAVLVRLNRFIAWRCLADPEEPSTSIT